MKCVVILALLICGSLAFLSVNAFPTAVLDDTIPVNKSSSADSELMDFPVFISVTEDLQQQTQESEITTESYMVVENQEIEEDDDDDSSTASSAIVRTTLPMQAPTSSPEQEEVLRELKKLWDFSEGLSQNPLKKSISSIVHLAYARVYSESDQTLQKLKYLLQKLQTKLLGTEPSIDEVVTTPEITESSQSSTPSPLISSDVSAESDYSTTNGNLMMATTVSPYETGRRRKRSYYLGADDIDSVYFTSVNSAENSLIPEDKKHVHMQQKANVDGENGTDIAFHSLSSHLNHTEEETPLERTLLSIGSVSSSTIVSTIVSSTPLSTVQKVVHINDRPKPVSPFFISPERIQELKSRMTSTTSPLMTSTLPPIILGDELENEVNSLQQQLVDNYDVHISKNVFSLVSSTPHSPVDKLMTHSTTTTDMPTDIPFTAEEIAIALFQLLKPDSDDDSSTSTRPPPSDILYQVDSLSSILKPSNFKNTSVSLSSLTSTTPSSSILDLKKKYNATGLNPPLALSNLGFTSTSTERQNVLYNYTDVIDSPSDTLLSVSADKISISPTKIFNETKENIAQIISALTGISNPAKMVILFAISISTLSIGLGVYSFAPPLVGVGILGILIPIGLLLIFETSAIQNSTGKLNRKSATRQQQIIFNKLHSDELSQAMDLLWDAIVKYNKR